MPVTTDDIGELEAKAKEIRKDIINTTLAAGGAHIGGALSMVEIMTLLYHRYLNIRPDRPDWADRDRVVVSKGHAGVGIAPVLAGKGYFPKSELATFNQFKSRFGMHLDSLKVPGVDVSTGSLGHGLSMAVGLALGARLQEKEWKTYCILGDGECNEGSVWEAAMSTAHFRLTNLVTLVDRNRLMIDGATEEVMGIEPFAEKWAAFGFRVAEVDGHDFRALAAALDTALAAEEAPVAVICHTVKGRGVSFMENEVKWHYGSMNSTLADQARADVDAGLQNLKRHQE